MSRKINLLLILIFLASGVVVFYMLDRKKPEWPVTFWGIVGTNASVLGIIYALVQLNDIRTEAQIIKAASNETKRQLLALGQFADVATAIKLAQRAFSAGLGF